MSDFIFQLPIRKIFIFSTALCVLSFFALLVIANVVNRKGITELNGYNKEIVEYEEKLSQINTSTATNSSLIRVEQRAKDMGFEKAKKIEYLK